MNYQPSETQCDRCLRDRADCIGNIDFSGMLKTAQIDNHKGETTIVWCDQFDRQLDHLADRAAPEVSNG
ncbi:hypothetical protein [Marinobacterium lutimaris]|uniref:Uncharacterized protein n=1 Tax=Marinobacterium lutimaris TaxID=568106 RepID=A0A1H5XQG7_9GAMM|nr:hypothetical protein [Marinobacterium lutimaris]SEG13735.1 hypothetical protein SAMN05444390_1011460 [Marinobacterium lutimaris]